MGKRKHKTKEQDNNNLNNKNPMDFINNNGNLNPMDIIKYLGMGNNSNDLNTNNLLNLLINNRLNNNSNKNPLMDLMANINTEGVNMNDINKLSESLKNTGNPQELLKKIIDSKLNANNNNNNNNNNSNDSPKRKRKNKDLDNLEFLKSLKSIVDPSKVELIDKIIVMYENGEI